MILLPARLTPYGGVVRSWKFLWTSLVMPTVSDRYHIYSLGQIHPLLVNLFPVSDKWKTIAWSNMQTGTVTDIYTSTGIRIPLFNAHYIFTEEKSLLIAIPLEPKLPRDFNSDNLFIRLYDNAYFESNRNTSSGIFVQGMKVTSNADIINIQSSYNAKAALPGRVYGFINGRYSTVINLPSIQVGDVVEFYHDPSTVQTYTFDVDSLDAFTSELDNKTKYLIHPPGQIGDTIFYQDDLDVYIVNKNTGLGVYINRNSPDTLRMLTHRDYSISQPLILSIIAANSDIMHTSNARLLVSVKESGYKRDLIFEHQRIKELYKLPEDKIYRAMIGVDSTVENWRVEKLEMSFYTKIMRSNFQQITVSDVADAYGYNSVVKLAAESMVKTRVSSGQVIADVPVLYREGCKAYEFATTGILTAAANHSGNDIYACVGGDTSYVMFIMGEGGSALDEYYNQPSTVLDSNYDYKFYTASKDSVYPNTVWTDVTDSGPYIIQNNTITWMDLNAFDVLVRSNKKHIHKTFYLSPLSGSLTFNLSHTQSINGITMDAQMQIPTGEIKLFLNNRPLIEGIDYLMNFPKVTITSKEYLVNPNTTTQKIDYILTGLCDADLAFRNYAETGFIRNGYLSDNNRFDIRDDRPLHVTAAGRMYAVQDMEFVEDSGEYTFNSALNGKPYSVQEMIVPIKRITKKPTYAFKQRSSEVDTAVSNYLTEKMPAPTLPAINPIGSYYTLYSPFISKVIFSIVNDVIDNAAIQGHYNNDRLRELVQPFLYLLDMDPIHVDNRPDFRYCIIHPHILPNIVEVDIYQYRFITRVVNLYGSGLLNLSGHLAIV